MRVLVAGASGAVGRQLVPMLVADGHEVTGTTRSDDRAAGIRAAGAAALVVDVYDTAALTVGVVHARPHVIVHQLTDLAAGFGPESLRANSRLREVGTRNLLDAALAAGARRIVAQGAAWLYAPGDGDRVEEDALLDSATHPDHAVLPGVRSLERLVLGTPRIEGVVLRYGLLYGPGTRTDGPDARPPVHVAAAARAAALAVTRGAPGIYNIVDDGGGVSNRRAREVLGWRPDAR